MFYLSVNCCSLRKSLHRALCKHRSLLFYRSFVCTWLLLSFCLLNIAGTPDISEPRSVPMPAHQHRMQPANAINAHPYYRYVGRSLLHTLSCQLPGSAQLCYGPQQIRAAYAIQPLLDRGITGKGRSIVILDAYQAPHLRSDLRTFDDDFHLPPAQLQITAPDGVPPYDNTDQKQNGWSGEITLDVEWAHVIAPDATIHLVLARSSNDGDLVHALQYAIEHNLGDVLTMSFGENEACLDPAYAPRWHELFQEAAQRKITLFASSGDTGASQYTCDNNNVVRAVSTPANDPLVTAVGGTRLNADVNTGAYASEVSWNDPVDHLASGGGYSKLIRRPFYQYMVPQSGYTRAVPDVAYNGAVDAGVLVVWSDGDGGPGAIYVNGGTSAGTPQWGALIALATQIKGQRLGFINSALYTLASSWRYPQFFHDITQGTNAIAIPDAQNDLVLMRGYRAASGWDAATGWGSPIAAQLLPALATAVLEHEQETSQRLTLMR